MARSPNVLLYTKGQSTIVIIIHITYQEREKKKNLMKVNFINDNRDVFGLPWTAYN